MHAVSKGAYLGTESNSLGLGGLVRMWARTALWLEARKVTELAKPHTLPVFRCGESSNPDHEGTGLLVAIDSKRYLVSAAHVFDQMENGVFLLLRGREDLPLTNTPIVTEAPHGNGRASDTLDLGFVRLTADEVAALPSESFLALPHQVPQHSDTPKIGYVLYGFRVRDQALDHKRRVYQTKGTRALLQACDESAYKKVGVSPGTHLLLEYDERKIRDSTSQGAPGSPKGMSGGGAWAFDPRAAIGRGWKPHLAGIFVERPERFAKSLLITRTEVLIKFLHDHDP